MKKYIIILLAMFLTLPIMANGKSTTKSNRWTTHITLTTYNPVKAQCNSNPLVTADGTKISLTKLKNKQIKYCAIARNLLPYIPYGSIIHIEGHGFYEVHDTMNKRFKHYVDILQHTSEKGFKKTNIRITLVKKGDGKRNFA